MLHPPTRRRERILLYGASGSGKSTAWLTIAEWLDKTKATGTMVHVLDSDRVWDDMAPYDGHLDTYVDPFTCQSWDDVRTAVRKLGDMTIGADDWLVIDMYHRMWDRVQEGYFEKAYGKEIDEFWTIGNLEDRARAISGSYGANWQAINKMYAVLTTLVMSRWPGHVLACTAEQKVWEANQGTTDLVQYPAFGKLGMKPAGQKDTPGQFRTILYLQQSPSGWRWTTAKERNPVGLGEGDDGYRGYREGEVMRDFVRDYLMKVGGWRP